MTVKMPTGNRPFLRQRDGWRKQSCSGIEG